MIKTLQQALKMDREKFKVPRSVQQAIPIQRLDEALAEYKKRIAGV